MTQTIHIAVRCNAQQHDVGRKPYVLWLRWGTPWDGDEVTL
jgi:hypothetical protein